MTKFKIIILGMIVSNYAYSNVPESINCRIVYDKIQSKAIAIIVGSKDAKIREKCEKQIRSKEVNEVFKKIHIDIEKEKTSFSYTCLL